MNYVKGYKAMYNGKCLNQVFEVGKTYQMYLNSYVKDGQLLHYVIQNDLLGFHYCVNPDDISYYYDIRKEEFELYEIIDYSGNNKQLFDRSVTGYIKINRKIPKSEYSEVFNLPMVDLEERSRIYVWDNNTLCDINYRIKDIKVY